MAIFLSNKNFIHTHPALQLNQRLLQNNRKGQKKMTKVLANKILPKYYQIWPAKPAPPPSFHTLPFILSQ